MSGPYTGDFCPDCGSDKMIRTGTCVTCQDCGSNTGCGRLSSVLGGPMKPLSTLTLALVLAGGCVSTALAERNLANVRALKGAVATAGVADPAPTAEPVAEEILGNAGSGPALAAAAGAGAKVAGLFGLPWAELAGVLALVLTGGKTALRVAKEKKAAEALPAA